MLKRFFPVKFIVPSIDKTIVRLEAVFQAMDQLYQDKTVFFCAPAGYGKTTNIAQWVLSRALPCAWVSLEENDNTQKRFMQCIAASLANHLSQLVVSPSIEGNDANMCLESILLCLYQHSKELVIVLDDFHHINDAKIFDLLLRFIQYKPKNIRMIVASRSDIPKQFYVLQTRQSIVKYNKRTFSFNNKEIEEFFKLRQVEMDEWQIDKCTQHTRGWVLGLVAMSLAMVNSEVSAKLDQCTGNEYIHQFLYNEIWTRLDDSTRIFLVKTSVLDEFSVSLAEELTGMEWCEQILTRLHNSGTFTSRFSSSIWWYRYHHVFREFIRTQARVQAVDFDVLHNAAARYFRRAGDVVRALSHYLQAGNVQSMMDLISENPSEILRELEPQRIIQIIDGLAPYGAFENIDICVCYEWALQHVRNPNKALDFVNTIVQNLAVQRTTMSQQEIARVELEVSAMTFPFVIVKKNVDKTISCLETMYLTEVEDPIVYRPGIIQSLYWSEYTLRDTAAGFYGRHYFFLRVLEAMKNRRMDLLLSELLSYTPVAMSRVEVFYELGDTSAAMQALPPLIDNALYEANYKAYLSAMICLANIQQSEGDFGGAYQTIEICELKLREKRELLAMQTLSAYRMRMSLLIDHCDNVKLWEEASMITAYDDVSDISRHALYQYLTLTLVLIKTNRMIAARLLIDRINGMLSKLPDLVYKSQALFLDAYIALKERQTDILQRKIDDMLLLGNENGYYRTFVDFGHIFGELMEFIIERKCFDSCEADYVQSLYQMSRTFTGKIDETKRHTKRRLTRRELEVLEYLSQDLSNQEIADLMVVSLQTVKNYTHSIYKKLSVKNRTLAVRKAKNIGPYPNV